ncbi:alginate lyase family protein [Algibacillus agarilyticus]|uniref:alginate lyase family protein n=1 Tax=Algibacillus agarilyticus TaxID=2234133 RepID=UPI000DCFF03F|nr:alginate lyase family protein [Algibacillus agarilyticus]
MNKTLIGSIFALTTLVMGCSSQPNEQLLAQSNSQNQNSSQHKNEQQPYSLTYVSNTRIAANKNKLAQSQPHVVNALESMLKKADKALTRKLNPVTNKPQAGPSGSKHDYVSIGPYWWPDKTKADGLPWIRKDGEVNPLTRGNNTDQTRAKAFLHDLGALNLAYLYTHQKEYLHKAKQLINTWLINPDTKMNPNLDYAQGVPGSSTGRPFGVIEWENIANVVTSIELLNAYKMADNHFIEQSNAWLNEYLTWLLTSKIGIAEGATKNNHATWYDYQVIGLMLHLGQKDNAKAYTHTVKRRRIDSQIHKSGAQPHELARTKSVSYTSMNLMAFLKVAELAKQVDIDLLHYKGDKGQSIKAATQYLQLHAQGHKKWKHPQIGGAKKAFKDKAMSTLFVANQLFNDDADLAKFIKQNHQYVKPDLLLTF